MIRFDVAGVIDLGGTKLTVREPHVTVDGSTAPSPGVTIIKGGLSIRASNVIFRHVRLRVGVEANRAADGQGIDGVETLDHSDIIFDHVSVAWGTDEGMSVSGPRFSGTTPGDWRRSTSRRITFHKCIIAEGLNSFGTLVHDNCTDIALVGNLWHSNAHRNPYVKGGARAVIVNNMITNYGGRAMQFALSASQWEGKEWQRGRVSVVGNIVRRGPSTTLDAPAHFGLAAGGEPYFDAYFSDNDYQDTAGNSLGWSILVTENGANVPAPFTGSMLTLTDTPPIWPDTLTPVPAAELAGVLLPDVGARPWDRDAVDARIVAEAATGGGKIIAHESEVGGYEIL